MGMITERMPAANYELQNKSKVIHASGIIESKLRATDSLKPQVDVTVSDKNRLSSALVQKSSKRSVDEPHSRKRPISSDN
jgi:hypothetical protein